MKMKNITGTGFFLVLFCLILFTLTACDLFGGFVGASTDETKPETKTETKAETESEKETETKSEYSVATEVFATFADLKANADLFRGQLPCIRSTKGYHAEQDGGAATYRITADKPEGISEMLARNCYAQIVTAKTDTSVSVKQFGAYGNGEKDDTAALMRGIRYAAGNGLTLEIPSGEYKTLNTLELGGINVRCENAKIRYTGTTTSAPAISVKNDVNLYGTLSVWYADNLVVNSDERCALLFGNYRTGEGSHNCYVESIEVSGGHKNSTGITVTGDSSDIVLETITVPEGTNLSRAILFHWGNADDYKVKDPNDRTQGIFPVDGAAPTKHPHGIRVKKLVCTGLDPTGKYGDAAAVYIAAAYDVTFDEITVSSVRAIVTVTGGDCGMEYASPEEKAHGMKGLKFGKVTATDIRSNGFYFTRKSDYLGDTGFFCALEFEELDVTNCPLVVSTVGIGSLKIGTLHLRNCLGTAVRADGALGTGGVSGAIEIGTVAIERGCGNAQASLIWVAGVDCLNIGTVRLTGATYACLISYDSACGGILLGEVMPTESTIGAERQKR